MYRSSYEDEYKLLNEDYFNYKSQEIELDSLNSLKDIDKELCSPSHSQSFSHESKVCSSDSLKNLTKNLTSKAKSRGKTKSQITDGEERKIGKWTEEEDEILRITVPQCGGKNWKKVAESVKGRTPIQCLHRWTKILQPGLIKGPWSVSEDKKLIEWVMKEGPTRWTQCAELINGRNGKQCRERWFNSLNPKVKKGDWSVEEDFNLFFYYKKFGGKWSKIAIFFEGRTENSIKNRFYSTLRRLFTERKKEISNYENYENVENNDNNDNLTLTANCNFTAGIEELKHYIYLAEDTVKYRLMKYYEYSEEDFKFYENTLNEKATKGHRANRSFKVDKIKIKESIKDMDNNLDFNHTSGNIKLETKNEKDTFNFNFNGKNYENLNPNAIFNNISSKGINLCNNSKLNAFTNTHSVIPQVNTFNFNLNFNSNNTNNSNNNYIVNPAISSNSYTQSSNINPNSHSHANFSNLNNNISTLNQNNNNLNNSYNNLNVYKSMDIYSLEKDISDMCDTNLFFADNNMNMNFDNQLDNLLESMFQGSNIVLTNDTGKDCNICVDKIPLIENLKENEKFVNENKFDEIYYKTNINDGNNYSLNLGLTNTNNIKSSNSKNPTTLECVNNFSFHAENKKEENLSLRNTPMINLDPLLNLKPFTKKDQQAKKSDMFQNLLNQLNGLEKLVKNAKKELSKYEKKESFEEISSIENLFKI